jgi:hypothetical protein
LGQHGRVARFSLLQNTKLGKKYQITTNIYLMAIKYFRWPLNRPKDHKKDQEFPIARPSKIYPKWDFRFENKPSGNPSAQSHRVE